MYFKALKDCTFGGETFKAGDMIDLGDKESVSALQRELGDLVEVTTPEKMTQEEADAAGDKAARADAREAKADAREARADAREVMAEAKPVPAPSHAARR